MTRLVAEPREPDAICQPWTMRQLAAVYAAMMLAAAMFYVGMMLVPNVGGV